MSDAFHYFRAHAVRALCKARRMPLGRIRHLQTVAGRIYHLLTKEAAYGPNLHHMDDFRAAQTLEASIGEDIARRPVQKTAQRRLG
jgi:hypothetical protein